MTDYSYLQASGYFAGHDPAELLAKYGSPLYVYKEEIFRERCREMAGLISGQPFRASYSIKSNSNLTLLTIAREEGLYGDAMSIGEILALEKAGFAREQIFFVPNNIDRDEMAFALARGLLISCDSLDQLELLGRIQPGSEVAARVNPGLGAGHHEKVVTAGDKTKFGINPADFASLEKILKTYRLKLVALNQHIGSLFMEPRAYIDAARYFLELAAGFPHLRLVDFGGGFGIPYRKLAGQERLDLADLGRQLSALAADFSARYPRQVLFKSEPGRYISAESGVLLGRVTARKQNGGSHYIGSDLGFNVLARPLIYDSWHDLEVWREGRPLPVDARAFEQTVVGNICESGDILMADRPLPPVEVGDCLAVLDAGAYGYVMSSNYNNRLRPAEVLIGLDGSHRLIRRRDSYEDLFRNFDL